MADRYESILEENGNLKKALQKAKSIIERTSNDYETMKQIHEEFKIQSERNKKESDDLQVKVIQLTNDKKELELQFDATIRNLKIAIDLKQREIEEVQQKIIPSFDQDMLRIKIINELEIPHRNIVEQKKEEIEKMQETIYDQKRQIDILSSKIDLISKEQERDLKSIKDRHQLEITELNSQLESLSQRVEDQRDKELIRKLRRENEEHKQKFLQKDQECEELRRERDKCREEKNETLIKFSKQIDGERNEKRLYKTESEKLAIRVRFFDEESKKNKIKQDSIINELEILKRERDTIQDEIRKKDDLIHQLQRRIGELEDDHVQTQGKQLEKEQRIYNEERDKFLEERNKCIALTREYEQCKVNNNELNEENKQLRLKISKDLSQLKSENSSLTEERDKLKRIQQSLEKDNISHEKLAKQREEQLTELERELESVRRKFRESQQRIANLESNVDTLSKYKQQAGLNSHTLGQNVLIQGEDSQGLKKELETEKKKNSKLKEKLKQANEKIVDLMQFKLKSQAAMRLPGSAQQPASLATPENKFIGGDVSSMNNAIGYQQQQQQIYQQPHIQNQFSYSYLNSHNVPTQQQYLGGLSYEDERILSEINKATDTHKFSYY